MDRKKLTSCAREAGADVIGIADIERFGELPLEKHPRAIFPETRSVVVLGRRITRGTLRGVEEGTNFNDYRLYGSDWLDNRFVALTTFRVAEFLEDSGWEAVPLPNLPPEVPPMGVAVRKNQPPPNVMLDFDDAAVRAGVAEIGYCGVLLTPQFGPRQRVQMILTDAPIAPSPILDKPVCPRSDACRGFCPLGACVGERELTICGKTMKVAEIDDRICGSCKNGARPNPYHPAGKPDRLAASCIRSCVDFLETSGRVENRFTSPFRKRPPWIIRQDVDFFNV
jgi:epoxyqueuosine reductase QueG